MAPSGHVGLANKGIYDLGACRQIIEVVLRPGVRLVELDVGERALMVLNDPLPHPWLIQIVLQHRKLLDRIAPPSGDLGCGQPWFGKSQIGGGEGSKAIPSRVLRACGRYQLFSG